MQCFSVECTTYCLQGLEEAVENQVPDDLPVLKGRDIPDEKVAEHGQRCGQHDPTGERQRQTETETERERITTKHGVRNMWANSHDCRLWRRGAIHCIMLPLKTSLTSFLDTGAEYILCRKWSSWFIGFFRQIFILQIFIGIRRQGDVPRRNDIESHGEPLTSWLSRMSESVRVCVGVLMLWL